MNFSDISSFINRKKLLKISFGIFIGFGLGYFFKEIFFRKSRNDEYILEILKEIINIKSEIKSIKNKIQKLDKVNKSTDFVDRDFTLDHDEFEDAQSSLDGIESFYSLMGDSMVDVENFIKEIDEILVDESVENYNKCYELCENELWKFQENGEFLWRYAMITYNTTILQDFDDEIRNQRIFGAFNSALTAVKKCPRSSNAHKWLAILYGVTGLLSDTQKRILNGFKFKEHIDKCLSLDPKDAYANHLKGRFCYQVSNLHFYERKIAAWLFATPPVATLEEALALFQKCEELAPNKFAENHYFLSLCYQSLGDYSKSSKFLMSAKELPCSDIEIKQKIHMI